MSVYERVREIGTMAAIGTTPGKIMAIFLAEGFTLGLISIAVGNIIGLAGIFILNVYQIRFSFGRTDNLLLITKTDVREKNNDKITVTNFNVPVPCRSELFRQWGR